MPKVKIILSGEMDIDPDDLKRLKADSIPDIAALIVRSCRNVKVDIQEGGK
ncbi:MAG: hypothetical protein PHQ43_04890 [Dehalococcoidales bacterium]|nr:hypothetical protein [Dehalococcoidales bacterium]